MNNTLHLLQQHFDTALESPDGIKKLRELILTLAMQGKLVKQDPKDQPASELMKETGQQAEKLFNERKVKYREVTQNHDIEAMQYPLPYNWSWFRFCEVVFFQEGPGIRNWQFTDQGVKLLNVSNILFNDSLNLNNSDKYVSNEEFESKYTHFQIQEGDLLFAGSGASWGKLCWFTDPGYPVMLNTSTMRLCFFNSKFSPQFLFYFMKSEFLKIQLTHQLAGLQPNFGSTHMNRIYIPIPPIAEQKRIVAKIDELMALCDKLEAQRNARNDKRLAVHTAAINRLLNAADKSDFAPAWQFITRHFDPLYSVKENVAELKKTILTLAMQGKLVKQDPKDQPASELLKGIQAEKERLVKEGKIKKQKELSPIKLDEVPYKVPEGWVWTRLGEAIYLEMGQSPDSQSYNQSNDGIPFFQGKTDFGDVSPTSRYWCTKPTKLAYVDDILLSVRAPVGPTNIANTNCCIGRGLAALRPLAKVTPKFINYLMINFRQTLESKATGTTFVAVSKGDIENLNIPFPPLAEQKRIVSKIDELMALCDKLEKQIDIAKNKQTALFDAVLAAV